MAQKTSNQTAAERIAQLEAQLAAAAQQNGKAGRGRKTECPVTRAQFAKAPPLVVRVGDHTLSAPGRTFSSGGLGWYAGGKVTVTVDGVPVTVQVGINCVVVGSKELPK